MAYSLLYFSCVQMEMALRMYQGKAEFKIFGWWGDRIVKFQIVYLTKSCGWSSERI